MSEYDALGWLLAAVVFGFGATCGFLHMVLDALQQLLDAFQQLKAIQLELYNLEHKRHGGEE